MSITEFGIIQKYFSNSEQAGSRPEVLLGPGDDCAALQLAAGKTLCMSMDVLNEAVHFPSKANPSLLAQRALSINLSDLAAMGAEPLCFTLGLSLSEIDEQWLAEFSSGLAQTAARYNCPLVGGDTTRGSLSIAIQVQGQVDHDTMIRRDGAHAGDLICVTGSLGNGSIALAAMGEAVHFDAQLHKQLPNLSTDAQKYFEQCFYAPEPRVQFARRAAALVTSAIDISDGLAGDLGHILANSKVGASINLASLPYDSHVIEITTSAQRQHAALYGGDDYELCLTVPPENFSALAELAQRAELALTVIGEIEAQAGLRQSGGNSGEAELELASFTHFQAGTQQ